MNKRQDTEASQLPIRQAFFNNSDQLEISVLGDLAIRYRNKQIGVKNLKARVLIGYLGMSLHGSASREHLVGLLWSTSPEDKARASLRQVIRSLRQSFDDVGFGGLQVDRQNLGLLQSSFSIDLVDTLKALDAGHVSTRLLRQERIADSLCEGIDDIDAGFRNWLMVQREQFGQRLVRGLEKLLEGKESDEKRKDAAQALIQIDPTHERACRHLMRAHASNGDTSAALAVYNRLWHLLDLDYDVEPTDLTKSLVAAIKLGEVPAFDRILEEPRSPITTISPPSNPTSISEADQAPKRLTLMVGHFDLDGVRDEQRHICLGFRSELIATLTRFRVWSIVDVSKSMPKTLPKIGYLINARLYQSSETVHLIMELMDPHSGEMIWSERFELSLEQYFAAQQKVVRKIAYNLNVHISLERLQQVAGQPDVSLDIYDRWLRGHSFVLNWAPDLRVRASEIFASIIADAPRFAPAYSSLVGVLNSNHFVFPGIMRSESVAREALRLAKIATEIDPLDSRSQLHLAWSHAMNGEFAVAELGFRLACELNDNEAWTSASASGGFAFSGRTEIAATLSETALELAVTPIPMVWAYVGCVRYILGDYEGCVIAAVQAEDNVLVMTTWKIGALSKLGRRDEAVKATAELFGRIAAVWRGNTEPTSPNIINWLVQCFPIRYTAITEDLRRELTIAAAALPGVR